MIATVFYRQVMLPGRTFGSLNFYANLESNRNAVSSFSPGLPRFAATLGNEFEIASNRKAVVSFPDVTLIPLYLVLRQQCSHLILETKLSMVILLVRYISLDLLQVRLTHGEISIARLPFEAGKSRFLFQPNIGYAFQLFNPLCLGNASTKAC